MSTIKKVFASLTASVVAGAGMVFATAAPASAAWYKWGNYKSSACSLRTWSQGTNLYATIHPGDNSIGSATHAKVPVGYKMVFVWKYGQPEYTNRNGYVYVGKFGAGQDIVCKRL
jgi:hypothetical protein